MIATRFRRISVILLFLFASLSPVMAFNASAQGDDELTCDDFTNQDAAQIVLDLDDFYEDTLDPDGDGEACPDLPARDDNGGGGGSSDLSIFDTGLVLGSDIDDFEDEVGDPADDFDADDFTIGTIYDGGDDYESVSIYWLDGIAAHIQIELPEELDEDDAYDFALDLLPEDADLDTRGDELDEGELIFAGESDILADTFFDEDYDDNGVGGAPGDLRVILIPGSSDFAVIDVAIGLGDEYTGSGGSSDGLDDGSDDGSDDDIDDSTDDGTDDVDDSTDDGSDDGGDLDADAQDYLEAVRDGSDQMLSDITDFATLLSNASNLSDTELDQLIDILDRWAGLEEEAASLDVPAGYEEIQQTYEDAAAALTDVSVNITAFIVDGDDAALDDAFDSLTEATTLLADLNILLSAEGV